MLRISYYFKIILGIKISMKANYQQQLQGMLTNILELCVWYTLFIHTCFSNIAIRRRLPLMYAVSGFYFHLYSRKLLSPLQKFLALFLNKNFGKWGEWKHQGMKLLVLSGEPHTALCAGKRWMEKETTSSPRGRSPLETIKLTIKINCYRKQE